MEHVRLVMCAYYLNGGRFVDYEGEQKRHLQALRHDLSQLSFQQPKTQDVRFSFYRQQGGFQVIWWYDTTKGSTLYQHAWQYMSIPPDGISRELAELRIVTLAIGDTRADTGPLGPPLVLQSDLCDSSTREAMRLNIAVPGLMNYSMILPKVVPYKKNQCAPTMPPALMRTSATASRASDIAELSTTRFICIPLSPSKAGARKMVHVASLPSSTSKSTFPELNVGSEQGARLDASRSVTTARDSVSLSPPLLVLDAETKPRMIGKRRRGNTSDDDSMEMKQRPPKLQRREYPDFLSGKNDVEEGELLEDKTKNDRMGDARLESLEDGPGMAPVEDKGSLSGEDRRNCPPKPVPLDMQWNDIQVITLKAALVSARENTRLALSKEREVVEELRSCGVDDSSFNFEDDSRARGRIYELLYKEERERRLSLERDINIVRSEMKEPFIVPKLLDALLLVGRLGVHRANEKE